MPAARLVIALAVLVGAGVGCSAEDDGAPSGDAAADLVEYCDAMVDYQQAVTGLYAATVEASLAGYVAYAEAAAAAAALAPDEVAEAHDGLAESADLMATRLQDANPQTLEDLQAVAAENTVDLDDESAAVVAFANQHCGFSLG